MTTTDKGRIRSLNRRGTETGKATPAEAATRRPAEPSVCDHCGAVFVRRTWRRDRTMSVRKLATARWTVCPACRQVERGEGMGRVRLGGSYVPVHEADLRARIAGVAAQATARQPERRLVSIDWDGDVLDVVTTSQKLAHRIAHELCKAFRGRAVYRWSDDGTLVATWERSEAPSGRTVRRERVRGR